MTDHYGASRFVKSDGTLQDYILKELAEGKIDFTFRATCDDEGRVWIYIHPANQSGMTTSNLQVKGNLVIEP